MSIAGNIQPINCSRVCEANYLTIFRTKQDLTAKGDEDCSKGKVKATWQGSGRLYRTDSPFYIINLIVNFAKILDHLGDFFCLQEKP